MSFFLARRLGPLGLAFTAYRLWQRLPAAQKARITSAVRDRLRSEPTRPPVVTVPQETVPAPVVVPVTVDDLTSPGTVADPVLEERRAEQALLREQESRSSDETKFEQLRREQEAERQEIAAAIDQPVA